MTLSCIKRYTYLVITASNPGDYVKSRLTQKTGWKYGIISHMNENKYTIFMSSLKTDPT